MTNRYIPTTNTRILGLDLSPDGLGYAVLEKESMRLVDWGVKNYRGTAGRAAEARGHFTELLERYGPDILALERYDDDWRRTRKTRKIADEIAALAAGRQIEVSRYTRDDVRGTFAEVNAFTKEEIAQAIVAIFPELSSRLPRHREIYDSEHYRMNIFDAVALAATAVREE